VNDGTQPWKHDNPSIENENQGKMKDKHKNTFLHTAIQTREQSFFMGGETKKQPLPLEKGV